METPSSLATGKGGESLRTERTSALSSLAPPRAGETGKLFADEVERAIERTRGEGPRAQHLDERLSARRAARRAGFGSEGESEDEPHASEATFRPEHAPVTAQPASTRLPPVDAPAAEASGQGSQPAVPSLEESSVPTTAATAVPAPASTGGQPATTFSPAASANAVAPTVAAPRPALAPGEARPSELPQLERPASAKSAAVSGASETSVPDPSAMDRADEILRQIRLHVSPSVQRLTLDLEPVDLGRLSVQLALRTGKVTAIVRAENAETLELLQGRKADLLAALEQRGIRTDSVSFERGFHGPPARSPTRTRPSSRQATDTRAPGARGGPIPGSSEARAASVDFHA